MKRENLSPVLLRYRGYGRSGALLGFTRIEAPEMDPTMEVFNEQQGVGVSPAPFSARELNWLPAVENLG